MSAALSEYLKAVPGCGAVHDRAARLEVDADDDFVTTSPAQSQPGEFLDAGLEPVVYSYISKRLQVSHHSFVPLTTNYFWRSMCKATPTAATLIRLQEYH